MAAVAPRSAGLGSVSGAVPRRAFASAATASAADREPSRRVFRVSERYVKPFQELAVASRVAEAEADVRTWPGLLRLETLMDIEDANRLIVISEWESEDALQSWLSSDACAKVKASLDGVGLTEPPRYRTFGLHPDDVFDPESSLEVW